MTEENIFDRCARIFQINNETEQRNETIKLLNEIDQSQYIPIVNHLIREVGLYPYMQYDNCKWFDKILINSFTINIGEKEPVTLHLKQSEILKQLIEGNDLILSAPTSFGKSFIIDALINFKKPDNVLIIVPTISLMDETRRRLNKFNKQYNIITTSNADIKDKNIFVFPQERAIGYIDKIKEIGLDLFIVDEFYKILSNDNRALTLKIAISKLSKISKQKYYLCPNISKINLSLFGINRMKYVKLDFNTVFLNIKKEICKSKKNKDNLVLNIINNNKNKQNLIYVNQPSTADKLATFLSSGFKKRDSKILQNYNEWLTKNYFKDWPLADSVSKGICIHYGKIHRTITQMNVKLFNENQIFTTICTSSLIEGVNTSAENLIIYSNKIDQKDPFDNFTYKNIIGRSGRMFKYFIGNVYILEDTPKEEEKNLELSPIVDDIFKMDEELQITEELNTKANKIKDEIYNCVKDKNKVDLILKLIKSGKINSNMEDVVYILKKLINLDPNAFNYLKTNEISQWSAFKYFMSSKHHIDFNHLEIIMKSWNKTIPELIKELKIDNILKYFELENKVTYNLSAYFSDINELQKIIFSEQNIDISDFVNRLSSLFMPAKVLQLEEYGLPRMISKKISNLKLLPIDNNEITITELLDYFRCIGKEKLTNKLIEAELLEPFDQNFIDYFYDGIMIMQ